MCVSNVRAHTLTPFTSLLFSHSIIISHNNIMFRPQADLLDYKNSGKMAKRPTPTTSVSHECMGL